jgi:hypothetical protein
MVVKRGRGYVTVVAYADTHPSVAEAHGVTVRKYDAKSGSWQRRYRRKLDAQSKVAHAADAQVKADKAAARVAKNIAAKIAKGGK